MNQNFTIELNDTVCSSCHCEDQKFLHHVWDKNKGHKICTSCVLLGHQDSFCPSCFDLVVESCNLIRCVTCKYSTHAECISRDGMGFKCSTCTNADNLIFNLKELKQKEDDGHHKVMDKKAATLLLTAAKIVKKLISKAHDESVNSAEKQATVRISRKGKAIDAVERFTKIEVCNDGPSQLDNSPEI